MENEKVLTPKDPEFLPVQFDLTEAQMNQLAVDYDPSLIPKALTVGDENFTFIHNKVMAIVKVRTGADKVRVKLKADSLAWGRKVDAYAKNLTNKLLALEEPWKKVKLDLEEAERKASEAKLAAEQARQAKIESSIANIRLLSEGLINANSKAIDARIETLEQLIITENVFGEFVEAAKLTGDIVMKSLQVALEERVAFEKGQVELEREQDKIREDQARLKRDQRALDIAQAAMKASEDAAKAAEAKEAQRKADEIREQEAAQAKQEADKKRVGYLKERMPQDEILRRFARELDEVPVPEGEITDPQLISVLDDATDYLSNILGLIRSNTQGDS